MIFFKVKKAFFVNLQHKMLKNWFCNFSFFKIGMIAKILFCFKQFLRPLTLIKLRNKYKFYIFWTLNPLISNENF